jgi:Fic family protein
MKPPYEITNQILELLLAISEKIGEMNATHLVRQNPELRKKNRIKTIQATLGIEGNTLSIDQITAIFEGQRVLGPKNEIKEVENAILVYNELENLTFDCSKSFLKAHKILMNGLVEYPGKYRSQDVGIVKGAQVKHVAPPGKMVPELMNNLFDYLRKDSDNILLKSCVFHYEVEFIHPFMDGNGRMGRLWQTKILSNKYPVFSFLPLETIIKSKQEDYYKILELCDKEGKSTQFIEFMLTILNKQLAEIVGSPRREVIDYENRIEIAGRNFLQQEFSRADYLALFKEISAPTASRDLKRAVDEKLIIKKGDKRLAKYFFWGKY